MIKLLYTFLLFIQFAILLFSMFVISKFTKSENLNDDANFAQALFELFELSLLLMLGLTLL
jgi:hypothetical protein